MSLLVENAPLNPAAVIERRVTAALRGKPHPLDPLSAEEINACKRACQDKATELGLPALRFNSIGYKEPNKYAVLDFLARPESTPLPPRRAVVVIQTPPKNVVIEAHLDLDAVPARITYWEEMEGVQPAVTWDDVVEGEQMLKANGEFHALMKKRYGITDLETVACDPWYSGQRFGSPDARVILFFLYLRLSKDDNIYAHPLDVVITYDMNTDRILSARAYGAQDTAAPGEPGSIPTGPGNFHPTLLDRPFRDGLRPLNVTQPDGPSFSIDGSRIAWQNWDLRIGFTWREGVVLYDVAYTDRGVRRPVLYRAALAEIIVPYGEPNPPYHTKCAYDAGDYGLGFCANSLELGCDCLGAIAYFDAVLNNARGDPHAIRRAVCVHEEDAGMAWKHWDYRTDDVQVRRMRRLVISFVSTIANYEYAYYWYLYSDGTIQYEIKLTGIVSTSPLTPDEIRDGGRPKHGTLVAPGVNAHQHQHFFCVRIDPSVDCPRGGERLRVAEIEAEREPLGPGNLYGVGFRAVSRLLESEQQAQRDCDPSRSRTWKVFNPVSRNRANGDPVGWKLMASTASPPLLAHPTSSHATRGIFATKHLWVTQYNEDEMCPAGFYPLHPDPARNPGIGDWTKADRNLVDADPVIWFNVGLTHIVRVEDYPVMPVELIGFHLKPWNFFDSNPTIDLAPARNEASKEVHRACCVEKPARI